ncbi:T9SS type A sorting domain-containing protein [Hymenobacter amundsenii]|uniref:T9SS type A sorting domain-containing protein n=1 Tax=Hymenobacter amundsenii TaxID=2006685 RepID=UPI0013FD4437|nr:T9SS type A sorting domain-containing protein [Hymenobacter amundsenii]
MVYALAVRGSDMYVGGRFTQAGGVASNNIAKWDGENWSSLGTGPANGIHGVPYEEVHALAVRGSDMYVGGQFTQAGGVAANNIAKWDGTGWSSLGTGPAGRVIDAVHAVAISGAALYVGGRFTQIGGVVANNAAEWDGTSWSSLGMGVANGTNETINCLAFRGTDMYVGGLFTLAGGKAATRLAYYGTAVPLAVTSGRSPAVAPMLSPNPMSAVATLTGAAAGEIVQVFNIRGQLVLKAEADAAGTVQLVRPVGMPAGVYLVHTSMGTVRLQLD